ncbi:MAG: hypothetical protein LBM04_05060 [Opitutaceae bacterium]|jgi:hypothetical protein|nr:hypothetical protein [Opitutaceae bacterium]
MAKLQKNPKGPKNPKGQEISKVRKSQRPNSKFQIRNSEFGIWRNIGGGILTGAGAAAAWRAGLAACATGGGRTWVARIGFFWSLIIGV